MAEFALYGVALPSQDAYCLHSALAGLAHKKRSKLLLSRVQAADLFVCSTKKGECQLFQRCAILSAA
jgi:hypothetical protein